ncbi:MAG TPA: hypothetical protein ENN16_00910, partial [Candidatus Omnitrophica bacterium]|nr:hypothetical protein [Candidatus Omnitrophota bacterium]
MNIYEKLLITVFFLPFISGLISPLIGRLNSGLRNIFVTLSSLSILILSLIFLRPALNSNIVNINIAGFSWPMDFSLSLIIDNLSCFMLAIVSLIGFMAVLYSNSYMKRYQKTDLYYSLLLFFIGSMNAAILSGDFINFFIFWEIMTIVSFFLVVFDRNKKAYEAGIKYFIMSGAGALFMLFGIALLYSKTGTLDFNLISENIVNMAPGLKNTILLMFLIGLGVKAGMVPMHTWLPEAHPIAPSPVSALLSGVMIKIALYMMIRVFISMFGAAEAWRLI